MQTHSVETKPTHALSALILGRAAMLVVWAMLPPSPAPVVLWGCLLLDTIILLWQISLIRATIRSTGPSLWSYVLSIAGLIAIAIVGTTGLNQLSKAWLLPPPAIKSAQPLKVDGQIAYLTGPIDFDTYEAMKKTLTLSPPPTVLQLNSSGGRIGAARGVARLVREAGLATHVDGTCASACTLIFAAGPRRTMSGNARIGFHGYRLNSNVATLNASEEQDRDKAAFIAQGVDATFLDRALAIAHDDMWFPSTAELKNAGVLTD